ncbi:endospore germination permease [Cohnella sp. WQ 127256]|uniref:GerAB/ArcD/ProY family transporter n=1 Tax=Cohnella sp. WQ 127256 TaxID=2938790 RepID=UPI002117E4F3|nr:endospore germination permease [Cohnella sp. WQ 127256]
MKGKVSQSQVYMLFTQYLFTTTIGFHMSPLIQMSQYNAWVSILLGAAVGLAMTYGSFRLAMRRPDRFLGEYGKGIVGRWLHFPLILFMIFVFLFLAAYILRQLLDLIIQVYLPNTPIWAAATLFGICLVYAVHSGIETIFRAAQGMFFLSIVSILLVPLFIHKQIDKDMAIALITHFDLRQVMSGGYIMASLFGELTFIAFLFPYFASKKKTMKSIGGATLTSIIIILANLIPTILIFGSDLTANLTYPELELLRYANPRSFLAHFDPALIAVWITSIFIKISLFIFVAISALTQSFALKDHKPFAFSMTAAVTIWSVIIVESTPELNRIFVNGEITLILAAGAIPLLYLLVDVFRSFGKKQA